MTEALQEILEALETAKRVVKEIEIGKGSEHFRHGRQSMQEDAVMAIDSLADQISDPANRRDV